MVSNEINVSDALEKIKEEIRVLKAKLAELFEERDDLIYHICPELRAKYAREIGNYQNRANYQELLILELKRRIEIARAALNREQSISEEEVDEQINKEYQEFHEKVEEEYQKSRRFQEEQEKKEEKRRFYEEQWKKQYGKWNEEEDEQKSSNTENSSDDRSGDDADDNATKTKEKPLPNAKELYRKIVKKLHPDMNPNATARDLELFSKATKAYDEGDIVTLQAIHDEVYGIDSETLTQEENMESLVELKEKLLVQIANVTNEIDVIKNEFPYSEKEFLDNPDAVKEKQDAIVQLIQEYEKEVIRLTKILEEVNKQMEEIKNKKEK